MWHQLPKHQLDSVHPASVGFKGSQNRRSESRSRPGKFLLSAFPHPLLAMPGKQIAGTVFHESDVPGEWPSGSPGSSKLFLMKDLEGYLPIRGVLFSMGIPAFFLILIIISCAAH
jgi:hypothetical protein